MRTEKVCIISKYMYPNDTRLTQQINVLKRYNVSCDVICLKERGQDTVEYENDIGIYRIKETKLDKQSFLNYLNDTFTFIFATFAKLAVLSLKNSYKIIIVHTLPEFMVFSTVLHKLFGSVIVLDGRDITVDLIKSRWPTTPTFLNHMSKMIEKLVAMFCDEIITASNGFKRSLKERGVPEEKITVIVNTADETIYNFIENQKNDIISENACLIYHGTVSERFGIIIAVEAMDIIRKYIPFSELHIFGFYDPRYRTKIEELIEMKNLKNTVILHDAVTLEEIYEKMFTMDFGIVPYLSDHFMNIALSTKTFEYIASGLPVIASKLNSSRELFSDDCISYAEPGDPEDLAKKVIDMCVNPDMRNSKRVQAYEIFKEYYTSESQYRKYMDIVNYYMGDKYKIPKDMKKKKLSGTYVRE